MGIAHWLLCVQSLGLFLPLFLSQQCKQARVVVQRLKKKRCFSVRKSTEIEEEALLLEGTVCTGNLILQLLRSFSVYCVTSIEYPARST